VAKRHGISEQTIYTWRKRFGGLQARDVKRLRQLEAENGRLKKLVAERDLEIEVMRKSPQKMVSVPARRQQVGMAGSVASRRGGLHAVLSGAIGVGVSQPRGREGRACGHAIEGAVCAVSALRLSGASHFHRPRRPSHEPRPGAPAVANGKAAGADASGRGSASPLRRGHAASTEWAEQSGATTSCSTIAPMVSSSSA